ncbi:hypothetical protein [Ralstonia solanacearum]|uniref:hypothetical protein n=1 Tax=Ralstonia solanacearum TaxID=305 RepID=UPI0004DA66A7|nr:hypothetical protein [Ralstonia solanacearum]KEI30679.1 hypothetical protein CQ06_04770 [Ralstonia solanacearum]KFX76984.1 hypothetical protein KR98_21625 [Ralstonia solanacearum]KFX81592.1 hypothetical protein KR99_22190 [Ralstonia solanacearum]OCQ67773.1 hypothetical protein AR465_06305 [Ralstonia solanacearum]OCQ71792.1 hypothetical protein AR464_22135 [Ralstonia solanacearum]
MKHTRYFLLAGTETTFELPLPFCNRCKRTANRFRQGVFSKGLVTFGMLWVMLGLLLLIPPEYVPTVVKEHLFVAAATLSVLSVGATALFRRPTQPQTSFYQPVFLHKLKRTFSGKIEGLTLSFTNADYALRFRQVNLDACNSGALVVDGGRQGVVAK